MSGAVHVPQTVDDDLNAGQPRGVVHLVHAVFQPVGSLLDVIEAVGQIFVAGQPVAADYLAAFVHREGVGQHVHAGTVGGRIAQIDEHLGLVIVHPRSVIDNRAAVEQFVQIGFGLFRQVLLGQTGDGGVSQPAPREGALSGRQCGEGRDEKESLHVLRCFVVFSFRPMRGAEACHNIIPCCGAKHLSGGGKFSGYFVAGLWEPFCGLFLSVRRGLRHGAFSLRR